MKRKIRENVKRAGTLALTCAMILTSFPGTYSSVYAAELTPSSGQGTETPETSVLEGIAKSIRIPQGTYIANIEDGEVLNVDGVEKYQYKVAKNDQRGYVFAFIDSERYTYQGTPIEPNITLVQTIDGSSFFTLTKGANYTVEYTNNLNYKNESGANGVGRALIKWVAGNNSIDFDNFYITYPIDQRVLVDPSISVPAMTYSSEPIDVNYSVSFTDKNGQAVSLTRGKEGDPKDYYISPASVNAAGTFVPVIKLPKDGNYSFDGSTDEGKYSYTGTPFVVSKKNVNGSTVTDANGQAVTVKVDAEFANPATTYTYDGTAKEPEVKVFSNVNYHHQHVDKNASNWQDCWKEETTQDENGNPITTKVLDPDTAVHKSVYSRYDLAQGTEYTVRYLNNTDAGTATVIISSADPNFTFEDITLHFNISGFAGAGGEVRIESGTGADGAYIYTGSEIKPIIKKVYVNRISGSTTSEEVSPENYDVTYSDNVDIGKGLITITGKNNYKFTITKTFDIIPKTIAVNSETLTGIESSITNIYPNYILKEAGTKIKFEPVVKVSGNTLAEDTDYLVEYSIDGSTWKKYEDADFLANVTETSNPVQYRISGLKNYTLNTINTEGTVIDGKYVKGTFNIIEAYATLTNKVSAGVCSLSTSPTHTEAAHSLETCGFVPDVTQTTLYYNGTKYEAMNTPVNSADVTAMGVTLYKDGNPIDPSKYTIVGTYDTEINDSNDLVVLDTLSANVGTKAIKIKFNDAKYYYVQSQDGDYIGGDAFLKSDELKQEYIIYFDVAKRELDTSKMGFAVNADKTLTDVWSSTNGYDSASNPSYKILQMNTSVTYDSTVDYRDVADLSGLKISKKHTETSTHKHVDSCPEATLAFGTTESYDMLDNSGAIASGVINAVVDNNAGEVNWYKYDNGVLTLLDADAPITDVGEYAVMIVLDENSNYVFKHGDVTANHLLVKVSITKQEIKEPAKVFVLNTEDYGNNGDNGFVDFEYTKKGNTVQVVGVPYNMKDTAQTIIDSLVKINDAGDIVWTDEENGVKAVGENPMIKIVADAVSPTIKTTADSLANDIVVTASTSTDNTNVSRDADGYVVENAAIVVSPSETSNYTFEPFEIKYTVIPVSLNIGESNGLTVYPDGNSSSGNFSTGGSGSKFVESVKNVVEDVVEFFSVKDVKAAAPSVMTSNKLLKIVPYTGDSTSVTLYYNNVELVNGVDYELSTYENTTTYTPSQVGTYKYKIVVKNKNFVEYGQTILYTIIVNPVSVNADDITLTKELYNNNETAPVLNYKGNALPLSMVSSISIQKEGEADAVTYNVATDSLPSDMGKYTITGIKFKDDGSSVYCYDIPTATDAVTDLASENINWTVPMSKTYEIGSTDIELAITSVQGIKTGTTKAPVFTLSDERVSSDMYTVSYETQNGEEVTLPIKKAGTYVLVVTRKDGAKYNWKAVSKEFAVTASVSEDVPTTLSVDGEPTATTIKVATDDNVLIGYKVKGSTGDYTWTENNPITGLAPNTEYEIVVKFKDNDENVYSNVSKAITAKTTEATGYIVRFADADAVTVPSEVPVGTDLVYGDNVTANFAFYTVDATKCNNEASLNALQTAMADAKTARDNAQTDVSNKQTEIDNETDKNVKKILESELKDLQTILAEKQTAYDDATDAYNTARNTAHVHDNNCGYYVPVTTTIDASQYNVTVTPQKAVKDTTLVTVEVSPKTNSEITFDAVSATAPIKVKLNADDTQTNLVITSINTSLNSMTVSVTDGTNAVTEGIAIEYATKEDFSDAKTSATTTISGLAEGTTYFVRVKKADTDTTTYTSYSNVMKATTLEKQTVEASVGTIANQTYTGSAITLTDTAMNLQFKRNGAVIAKGTLVSGRDYVVSYENNTNVGTATVKVSPVDGSLYSFTEITGTFNIVPASLSAVPQFNLTAKAGGFDIALEDSKNVITMQYSTDQNNWTTFTDTSVKGLKPNTKYFVRAKYSDKAYVNYNTKDVTTLNYTSSDSWKITYNLNGGKNSDKNPATYNYGKAIELQDPTRDGYTFKGWYNGSNKVTKITETTYGDITLEAKWEKKESSSSSSSSNSNSNSNSSTSTNKSIISQTIALIPSTVGQTVYTIVRGDTLSKIANKFGTTVQKLAADNGIKNVNLIYAGKTLLVNAAKNIAQVTTNWSDGTKTVYNQAASQDQLMKLSDGTLFDPIFYASYYSDV